MIWTELEDAAAAAKEPGEEFQQEGEAMQQRRERIASFRSGGLIFRIFSGGGGCDLFVFVVAVAVVVDHADLLVLVPMVSVFELLLLLFLSFVKASMHLSQNWFFLFFLFFPLPFLGYYKQWQ